MTLKHVVGIGINGKLHSLADLYIAYVGLVNISYHTHVGEVLGYLEERRRIETGSHGLTLLHLLAEHHSVDGRGDGSVTEVGGSFLHILTTLYHHLTLLADTLGGLHKALICLVEGVIADEALVMKGLLTLIVLFLITQLRLQTGQASLGGGQVGTRGVELAGQVALVEFGYHLAGLYHAVVINIQATHDAAHLSTHVHGGDGLNGAGGRNGGTDVSLLSRHHHILHLGHATLTAKDEKQRSYHHSCHDCIGNRLFLVKFHII